ncbi:SGNH hydrolase-type esterase domain-containing protein [Xylariaceae sp. FL0594]|nr:SGNH hydrolase-type esterase domain-containing protein [Xylariaceae sp. FL0594]
MFGGTAHKLLAAAATCLLWTTSVLGAPLEGRKAALRPHPNKGSHWVATWTSMPQLVEPANLPPAPFTGSGVFQNATLRQTLHMSIGAERIRIQIANIFGGSVLPITAASIALPTGGLAGVSGIDTTTLRALTFNNGSSSVDIPQGQVVYTDPIDFDVAPQSMLTVTLYSEAGQSGTSITGHPGSRTTSWMQQGNHVNDAAVAQASAVHWYFLTAVEAWAPSTTAALVILGDSITDGRGSTDNQNNRWPDLLLARMQKENITNIAVVNQAAGGNAVLTGGLGPPLLQRYKRDLLQVAGVKYGLIFEGVNDIGVGATDSATQGRIASGLVSAFKNITTDAKAAGITMFGATITPFSGNGQAYSDPTRDAARQRVNKWILAGGGGSYVATIDFAKILANPANASILASQYDGGDHLHPNPAGYQAIADHFPLGILKSKRHPGWWWF